MGLQTREGVVDQIHVNGRPLRESSESQKEGATKPADSQAGRSHLLR